MSSLTEPMSPLARFFRLLSSDKQEIFNIYVYAIFNGLVNLSLPLGIQAIINLITGGQVSTSWIVLVVIVIAGIAITGLLQVMQLSITENIQQKIFTRSAFEFAYRIPRMKMESVNRYYVPELVNRFFDTLTVQKGLSKILIDFSTATLQVIFGLILLSFYHPFFIIFGLILLMIVILIFVTTGPVGLRTSLKESKYKYEVAHWLEELARTMVTFKLAGKTDLPFDRTDNAVSGYLKSRKAHFRVLVLQYLNMIGFKVIVAAGLLVIGGLLVIRQQMNIGQFVAAEIIIILVMASVEKLVLAMETIYDVLTALEKIGYVMDIPMEEPEGLDLEENGGLEKGIRVKISKFNYTFPDSIEPVLKDINLTIKEGEKVCIAGYNGSGKTLLLQMIAGLYDGFSGSISYNGIPKGNLNIESLRSLIGDSLSTDDIFQGTLMENISMGKSWIPFSEIKRAAEVVGLDSYVETLENGYSTMLNPSGRRLPGSVALRIKLARGIACSPRLILIEESLTRLVKTDRDRFTQHLLDPSSNWTLISVSNDPTLAMHFDRIIVMEKGRIIDSGTYAEVKEKDWFNEIFKE